MTPLRAAAVRQQLFFPDRRLVQFDCGKLQALASLLRTLKSGGHKARSCNLSLFHRPISVYRLVEMPIQSCGQSISAPHGKAGARLNAHTELRTKHQRSAREAIYRNRPVTSYLCARASTQTCKHVAPSSWTGRMSERGKAGSCGM